MSHSLDLDLMGSNVLTKHRFNVSVEMVSEMEK